MLKFLALLLVLFLMTGASLLCAQDEPAPPSFSPDQLDNLLAPVALYPDPLLAQILLAATFPDQIDEAARVCRAGEAGPDDIDTQPWDVSVKAVAHYPTVLDVMADNLDWTAALGQAYVTQTDDVMDSIQRLREEAREAGNLATNPQQDVETDDGYVDISPAEPEYLYIPAYDPGLVFFGSGGVFGGPVITFGTGFPIGVWLNHGFDWRHRRIYYHGWSARNGWVGRSRAYIRINSVYVNDKLKTVTVNRDVVMRRVNYSNLTRYNSVHQELAYGNTKVDSRVSQPGGVPAVNNKVIERNAGINDPRINMYRGRADDNSGQPGNPSAGSAAFASERSNIDARAASQRGQSSRSAAARPSPAPKSSGGGFHGNAGSGGGSHSGGGGGGGSHGGGGRH